MSVSLAMAATKWARAVRDRKAATAALRKARLAASASGSDFTPEGRLASALAERVTAVKRVERRAETALLKAVEREGGLTDSVVDVEEAKPLLAATGRGL